MQRLIANLLLSWIVLLLPGAAVLDLAQPQQLLPACCRTHGAHHCAMALSAQAPAPTRPAWRGPGCPFAHLLHAAMVLPAFVPAARLRIAPRATSESNAAAELSALSCFLAGLPEQRGPPPSI